MTKKADEASTQNKRYYSIGEVASLLNVNSSLIRYWEKHFPKIKPKKNRKGHRLFTNQDIEQLKFIYFLVKEKGYSLENAKTIIHNEQQYEDREYQIAEKLKATRAFLLDLKQHLDDEENPEK